MPHPQKCMTQVALAFDHALSWAHTVEWHTRMWDIRATSLTCPHDTDKGMNMQALFKHRLVSVPLSFLHPSLDMG